MGSTHALVGACAGLGVGLYTNAPPLLTLGYALAGAAAGLLPDVDHPRSTVRNKLGVPGHVAFFWLPHRGLTHTTLAVALVLFLSLLLLPMAWGGAVIAGYALHLLADGLTPAGVPLLYPFWRANVRLLPSWLCIRTGGWQEWLFSLALAAGAFYVMTIAW
jgi:inner membrane protein